MPNFSKIKCNDREYILQLSTDNLIAGVNSVNDEVKQKLALSTVEKANKINVNQAIGSATRPIYLTADGTFAQTQSIPILNNMFFEKETQSTGGEIYSLTRVSADNFASVSNQDIIYTKQDHPYHFYARPVKIDPYGRVNIDDTTESSFYFGSWEGVLPDTAYGVSLPSVDNVADGQIFFKFIEEGE